MSTVGYSTLDVIPSVKNLRSQLEQQTGRDFAAAGKRGGQQFGDAAGKEAGGRFKSKFGSIAKDAFAPIAGLVAGAAVVGLFKDAISGASDLAESGNKVKVIFGDATGAVDKFASQGAKTLGETKLEVLNAASSFGVFGKAAGLSGKDLGDFATKLAGLSTDMASFFNTDPTQAAEAIAAGLRGESEPLRQFGVLLDDATLRQEALRQGLVATTKQALTPQQRVLAAYQVILRQTADAQGDFSRTSGGLANQQRILAAQWSEMKTELGSKLLPAATDVVRAFNNGVIPAMEGTGGAVGDAVGWFSRLPAPVKAATGALVAFKLAQATGATAQAAAGFEKIGSIFSEIGTRAKYATAAYQNFRSELFVASQAGAQFSGSSTRVAASLEAVRAASFGAGAAMRRGLSGALGIVGGPWGAAFIAGTAIVAHFWQEHQKAKQRVEDFTATLDKETGALTASSREFVARQLLEAGVLKSATRLGVSLELVTDAALGQKDALAILTNQIAAKGQLDTQGAADAIKLKDAIGDTNGTVQQGIAGQKLFTAAVGGTSSALSDGAADASRAAGATSDYASALDKAKDAVRKLLDVENKRRNANLTIRQDRLALVQQLQAAREEAAKGARTLDVNTKAGQDNQQALFDLASQWNNSAQSVKNAKGAYANFRDQFIKVATSMGDTSTKAQKLADDILNVPRRLDTKVTTPGMKQALRDLAEMRAQMAAIHNFKGERIVITAQATKNLAASKDRAYATGGMIRGPGSGTSDSILMWGSNGEYMQRKAAVDYYGVDFMNALNSLRVPKYATGGPVGAAPATSTPLGQEIAGSLRIVDGVAYIEGVARAVDARKARESRVSALDGGRGSR